jgi:hypothetical protein
MKDYSKIVILLLIILLVALIINSVFNFTDIIQENYEDLLSIAASTTDSDVTSPNPIKEDKHVAAIVSKYSGKAINVEAIGEPPTKKCVIKFYGQNSLSMNDDGTYSVGLSNKDNIRQQWMIIHVTDYQSFLKIIPQNNKNMGASVHESDYPFYMIISAFDNTKCLQYDSGSILVRPIGNYNSQKWDISYQKVENAIATHKKDPISGLSGDFRTDGDSFSSNEYNNDFDKIKLKLNLSPDTLQSILGSSGIKMRNMKGNNAINLGNDNEECLDCNKDNWIPRSSIKSICSGCDPDQIDPPN